MTSLDVLTREQCAARLGVNIDTLWKWRQNEQLPYCKVGRRVYFRAADVDAWLAARQQINPPAPPQPTPRRRGRTKL